jgi:putative flippase GtrA
MASPVIRINWREPERCAMREAPVVIVWNWLGAAREMHGARIIRFGIVGTCGVLVNYAILITLVELFDLNRLIAVALANETAILSNFFFNNLWTFRDVGREIPFPQRALRYNVLGLGGLLVSVTVLGVLSYGFGMQYLLANAFAIGMAMTWNYLSNARWTWSLHTAPMTPQPLRVPESRSRR